MISFTVKLINPFRSSELSDIWSRVWRISENWCFESNIYRHARYFLAIEFDSRIGGINPGVSLDLGLFGFCITLQFFNYQHQSDLEL